MPHSYLQSKNMNNEQTSELVGKNFCAAFIRQRLGKAEFIEFETNALDFTAIIEGQRVAIELVSYRQLDKHTPSDNDESKFKDAISVALDNSDLPTIQPRFSFRTVEQAVKDTSAPNYVVTVPRRKVLPRFICDFLKLAKHIIAIPELDNQRIWFVKHMHRPNQEIEMIKASEYPVVSKYCESVKIQKWLHDFLPQVLTNKDARLKFSNTSHVESWIQRKTDKLTKYRAANPDKPVWLVMHADGSSSATRIMEEHRPEILKCIETTHASTPSKFEQVWWMENAICPAAAKLIRVV